MPGATVREAGGDSPVAARAARLGRGGEARAAAWYEAAGFAVLERNWRSALGGELDLVCRRGRLLVVCEVKARTSDRFGSPVEAVDARKRRRLRRLAGLYLSASGASCRGVQVRFDVATVGPSGELVVLEGAFA